jgi:hypothetical protein
MNRPGGPLKMWAVRALSSPSESAAIVRALLERCGVPDACTDYDDFGDTWRIDVSHELEDTAAPLLAAIVNRERLTSLILRLLDATNPTTALQALRESTHQIPPLQKINTPSSFPLAACHVSG